jgi:hypothetical protein
MNGIMGFHDKEIVYLDADALGITQGFQPKPDGSGYTQEMRIPWTAIVKSGRPYVAGESFGCMLDLVWGPDAGKGWPINHMMDLVKPGAVHTGWFWEVGEIHGQVMLSPTGRVEEIPDPTPAAAPKKRLAGTIPIRVTLPAAAKRFTVVVEDAAGRRLRNLAGDADPAEYTVAHRGRDRVVEVPWDGLDDRGALVAPGAYTTRGLWHTGLDAAYEMSCYNPGTPPWETRDGRGNWMADHSSPALVAAAGDGVTIACPGAEGGHALIGVGPDGRKRWGDKQGGAALAGDGQYVYVILDDAWSQAYGLARFRAADGTYAPYDIGGKPTFPVTPAAIFSGAAPGKVVAMAVHGDTLVLAMSGGTLAVLDAKTAALRRTLDLPAPTRLAFGGDGTLYALRDGAVLTVDLATGATRPVATPGVGRATAITVDHDGNLLVADMGPDCQVKAFNPRGDVVYTAGKRGGRPWSGTFDPRAMMAVSSVSVDATGDIWVTERWEYPRRVSVWGRDGRLVRDFVGNTAYAGSGSFLHDRDPSLAYYGPVEMRLDKRTGTWRVSRLLWVPDVAKDQFFPVSTGSDNGIIVTSRAGGRERTYLYTKGFGHPRTVYLERNGCYQPVASIGLVKDMDRRATQPGYAGPFAGLKFDDGVIWNDLNRDGRVSRDELTPVPGFYSEGGYAWGECIGSDLVIRTLGYSKGRHLVEWRPVRFLDGAPVYGLEGRRETAIAESGDLLPLPEEGKLFVLSHLGWGGTSAVRLFDTATSRELWRYPSPDHGVHGSHHAPMPEPGRLIGGLKALGWAFVNRRVGRVAAVRGNLGQDFLFTADGLFVGALFTDCRLPSAALPDTEAALRGQSMTRYSLGGEPFDGWFGSQADGKVRVVGSMGRQGAMIFTVTGLASIHRYRGPALTVTAAQLTAAERANTLRKVTDGPKAYTLRRMPRKVTVDGSAAEWDGLVTLPIARADAPTAATARLAYDNGFLYLLCRVQDPSPWLNEGKDATRLFKTGDAVDLQLGMGSGRDPQAGDLRVVFAALGGTPAAVLMRPVDPAAPADVHVKYHSPVGERLFDRVAPLPGAQVAVARDAGGYTLEAALPLTGLGLALKAGVKLRGDVGVIASDAAGLTNIARTYWAQPATNLVNDLPSEAWFSPRGWGELAVE